jgi:hypothetical protein
MRSLGRAMTRKALLFLSESDEPAAALEVARGGNRNRHTRVLSTQAGRSRRANSDGKADLDRTTEWLFRISLDGSNRSSFV